MCTLLLSLGNHKLDTNNIETCAKQLAKAFVFDSNSKVIRSCQREDEFKWVSLGKVTVPDATEDCILSARYLEHRLLREKLGPIFSSVIFADNDSKYGFSEVPYLEFSITKSYRGQFVDQFFYGDFEIYPESVSIFLNNTVEWPEFQYVYSDSFDADKDSRNDVEKYRSIIRHIITSLGGNKVYHIPHQITGEVFCDKMVKNWEQAEKESKEFVLSQGYSVLQLDADSGDIIDEVSTKFYDVFEEKNNSSFNRFSNSGYTRRASFRRPGGSASRRSSESGSPACRPLPLFGAGFRRGVAAPVSSVSSG